MQKGQVGRPRCKYRTKIALIMAGDPNKPGETEAEWDTSASGPTETNQNFILVEIKSH